MGLNSNFATSKIAPQERWLKLYRKIHNLFLVNEFIHITDYNLMVTEMNARITAVETLMTSELAKVQIGLATHTHPVTTAGGPTNQVGIAAPSPVPPFVAAPAPTKPVVPVVDAMRATDDLYKGMGPAFAPIGDGIGVEANLASVTATTEVGT